MDKFRTEDAEILIVVPEEREKALKYASAMGFRGLKNMSETMSRLEIGDIAPKFSFAGQHEKTIELENLKGKILVIFFVRSLF